MTPFPLRLVPWEEFFFYKDRQSHTVTFFARFEFSQPLIPGVAEEAFRRVCVRQPLTRATVKQQGGRLYWVPSKAPEFTWSERPIRVDDLERGGIDIGKTPGLRIIAFAGDPLHSITPRPASVLVVIHHVAFDGLGVLQLLLEWMSFYQRWQQTGNWEGTEAAEEPSLQLRCRPNLDWKQAWALLPGQWKSLRASLHLFGRQVVPLANSIPAKLEGLRAPCVERLSFDSETTMRLKRMAADRSATLNSYLLSQLFRAIDKWQRAYGMLTPGTHLRVMVPINERTRAQRRIAACNHCTMIHLDRTRPEIENSDALLASIEQEIAVIQRWKLSLNFWRALRVIGWLPGGLRRFRESTTAATASLTNLGRLRLTSKMLATELDQPGVETPLKMLDFEIVAPLIHGTMAAFAIAYMNGDLRLTLHYDRDHIDGHQASELMRIYRQQLLFNEG